MLVEDVDLVLSERLTCLFNKAVKGFEEEEKVAIRLIGGEERVGWGEVDKVCCLAKVVTFKILAPLR